MSDYNSADRVPIDTRYLAVGDALTREEEQAEQEPIAKSEASSSALSGPRIVRADQLAALGAASPLTFLPLLGVSGYIVPGWSHLIAGFPRTGKTHLLLQMVREWATAGVPVLYITEESEPLWALRLGPIDGDWRRAVHLCFALGVAPSAVREVAFERSEHVVVLDAIRNVLLLQDENDNSAVARAITPWIRGARSTDKTLIALHHTRKSGGTGGEGIAETHALMASFDVVIELQRDEHAERRRVLRTYARVISPPELVYEMTKGGTLAVLGALSELALDALRQRLRTSYTSEWQKTSELRAALGEPAPSSEHLRRALLLEVGAGLIQRNPPVEAGDARGRSHRWRLAPTDRVPTEEGSVGTPPARDESEVPAEPPKGRESLPEAPANERDDLADGWRGSNH